MDLFAYVDHWRRVLQVKRFERYIQKAIALYRYDPKPLLNCHGITTVNHKGHGAILAYCPESKKLYYFSQAEIDPALVRVAETMLVIHLETPDDSGDKSYIVTMCDVTSEEGPVENRGWLHYMQALDRLMPIDVIRAIRTQLKAMDKTTQLPYAYCRIFRLPMGIVKKRYNDATLGIHHQTSFTDSLSLLKDKLSHDPRIIGSDHSPPSSPPERRGRAG